MRVAKVSPFFPVVITVSRNRVVWCLTGGLGLALVTSCSDTRMVMSPDGAASLSSEAATGDFVEVTIGFRDSISAADRTLLRSVTTQPSKYEFRGQPSVNIFVPNSAVSYLRAHPRVPVC